MTREYFALVSTDEGGLDGLARRLGPDVVILRNTIREFAAFQTVVDARFGSNAGNAYIPRGGWVALAYRTG